MQHPVKARLRVRKGQTMAEYAVVLALVAVAAIAALTLLGTDIAGVLSSVTDSI